MRSITIWIEDGLWDALEDLVVVLVIMTMTILWVWCRKQSSMMAKSVALLPPSVTVRSRERSSACSNETHNACEGSTENVDDKRLQRRD